MTQANQLENENTITKEMQKSRSFKSLFVVHVNINGFKANGKKLEKYLFKNGYGPDVICISETHGSDKAPNFETSKINYNRFLFYRRLTDWSGVGMYVNSSLRCKERKDLSEIIVTNSIHQWVELTDDHGKQIIVGVVYRHDDKENVKELCQVKKCKGTKQFLMDFTTITEKIEKEGKAFYVLGDFNIHLEESENLEYTKRLEKFKYKQLIKETTRVDKSSKKKSLIDHIYTNNFLNKNFKSAGVANDLKSVFDHYPIYCFIPNTTFYCNIENNVMINLKTLFESGVNLFEKEMILNPNPNPNPKPIEFFCEKLKNSIMTRFQDSYSLLLKQLKSLCIQFFSVTKEFKILAEFITKFETVQSIRSNCELMIKIFNRIKTLSKDSYSIMLLPEKSESLTFVKESIQEILKHMDAMKICDLLKIFKSIEYSDDNFDSTLSDLQQDENSEWSCSDTDEEESHIGALEDYQDFDWTELSKNRVSKKLKIYLRDISLAYKIKLSAFKNRCPNVIMKKYGKLLEKVINEYNEKNKIHAKLSELRDEMKKLLNVDEFEIFLLQLSPVKCPRIATFLDKLQNLYSQLEIEVFETKTIFCIYLSETNTSASKILFKKK